MLRKALWILLIVGLIAFAVFCMWRAGVLGSAGFRIVTLTTLIALGALAAAVPGFLAGRSLRGLFQRKPASAFLFVLIGAANFAVFHLLWGPAIAEDWGHPDRREFLTQAFPAVAAVFLLALSSYILGYLLIRPRVPIRKGGWFLSIFLLYGSILAGILTGDARFRSRGFISPLSLEKVVPFEKAFHDDLECFPRLVGNPGQTGEFTLSEGQFPVQNYEIPPGEVIHASGSVALIDGKPLELIGYGFLPTPGSTLSLGDSREEGKALFWDPGGRPITENLIPWSRRMGVHTTDLTHEVAVVLVRPSDLDIDLFAARFRFPTWDGMNIAESFHPVRDAKRLVLYGRILFPVPGPMELRLEFFRGRTPEYAMPAVQGATIELPWNRLSLHALRPHRLDSAWSTIGSDMLPLYTFTPEPVDPEKPVTTAIFQVATHRTANLDIHAVLKDGTRVPDGEENGRVSLHLRHCEFNCALEEIAEFRISSATGPARVSFELPGIPVFPEVNKGVKNLLDVRFPALSFENREDVGIFIRTVFDYYGAAPDTDPPNRPHEYWSIRDILNYYFPDRWYVHDGRLQLSPLLEVPILRKIILAVRVAAKYGGSRPNRRE